MLFGILGVGAFALLLSKRTPSLPSGMTGFITTVDADIPNTSPLPGVTVSIGPGEYADGWVPVLSHIVARGVTGFYGELHLIFAPGDYYVIYECPGFQTVSWGGLVTFVANEWRFFSNISMSAI